MKKDGINILGYFEQKFSERRPVLYSNGNGFKLKFSEEDEIRMGLWAGDLSIYKDQKDVSSQLLMKNFLTTFPSKYDPFSFSGRYCLIPTCPVLNNPSVIVVDTENITKREINLDGALMSNQFAPDSEKLLITGYAKFFVYDCESNLSSEIEIKYNAHEIDYANWIDSMTIRLMVSSKADRIQRIINYNIESKEHDTFEIISPGEVFGFEPLEEITRSNNFCLFNAKGYSSASVGRSLNQWTFIDFDNELNIYNIRTSVPVSAIYYNNNWKVKGIRTIEQYVEFDFNNEGITGRENSAENIGYAPIEDEKKSSIWSKLKGMWN